MSHLIALKINHKNKQQIMLPGGLSDAAHRAKGTYLELSPLIRTVALRWCPHYTQLNEGQSDAEPG